MRVLLLVCWLAALVFASDKKVTPTPVPGKAGVKTPGVQIPIASLKAEEQVELNSTAIGVGDLAKSIAGIDKPCGGSATAFGSIWVPDCATQTLFRVDPKKFEVTAKIESGAGSAAQAIAASADSIWLFTDERTTLARIDPETNRVVAEIRLEPACSEIMFAEGALWVACPSEDRVLRVNPATNVVDKRIEVAARPRALTAGENSIWVLCEKDGRVDRIDPKTNKVSKSIELLTPGAAGAIAFGASSLWITQAGFPIARIDPQTERVVQQFWGTGGGAIQVSGAVLWLSNVKEKTIWKIDPKRVLATLAE